MVRIIFTLAPPPVRHPFKRGHLRWGNSLTGVLVGVSMGVLVGTLVGLLGTLCEEVF